MSEASAPTWSRDTSWRQGQRLLASDALRLQLYNKHDAERTAVIAISHDCDIANENLNLEPNVEAIVGRFVRETNGNFLYGKNPRILHLPVSNDGEPATVELVATDRVLIPKESLAATGPDVSFKVDRNELATLSRWLSSRYRRAAFANEFERRMVSTKIAERLAKRCRSATHISAIYLEVDYGEDIERTDGAPYEVKIFLAYRPGQDPLAAHKLAELLSNDVNGIFEAACYQVDDDRWMHFCVTACEAVSEDDLTITQANLLKPWRLDYLSVLEGEESSTPFESGG